MSKATKSELLQRKLNAFLYKHELRDIPAGAIAEAAFWAGCQASFKMIRNEKQRERRKAQEARGGK